jgi:ABC-type glycerol-3-phosphate transport system substrate-binding protein
VGILDTRFGRRSFLKRSAAAGAAVAATALSGARRVAAQDTVIRYNAVAEPISDYIRDSVVPGFTEETGIGVEVDTTDYVRLHDKQVLDLQSDRYDVYQVDQVWLQAYALSGFLEDIGALASPEDIAPFYPNLVAIGNVNDTQWVLPLSAIPVDYYYRKDILDAQGLAPADTWDDVLTIAEATLTDDRYGFAVRGERGNPITWTWLPMLWAFGGQEFDESGAAAYNSEQGVASVELFKQINATSAPGWLSAQDVAALMQQDKSAQTTLMSVYNGAMDDPEASSVVGLVEFGEMPMQEKRATILGMWTIGIGARSPNKDAAWQFVEYLSRPEIAAQMALDGVVGATQPEIYQLPDAPRYFPTLGKVLEYATPPPLIPQAEEWFLITGTELQNALSGAKTPQQAMDDAAAQVNTLLGVG